MNAHTPGKMNYGHLGIHAFWIAPDFDALPIATVPWDCDGARDESRENARRLVACWNALRDLSTEQIEDDAFVKMRADRDALLARIEVVRADLMDAIDGGEELRSHDQWLSGLIRQLDGESP